MTMPLRLYSLRQAMLDFYKKEYTHRDSVDLFTFYEEFYRQKPAEEPQNTSKILTLRRQMVRKLTEYAVGKRDIIDLQLSDLRTMINSLGVAPAPHYGWNTYGALLQPYLSDGQYKSYVDAVFTGYGKLLGRFLFLFPQQYTSELRDWAIRPPQGMVWVDNADASRHNANDHPPILNNTFTVPGRESCEQNAIPLTELNIHFEKDDNRLSLRHRGTELKVFDYGLEALPTRSPMYRMLSTFSVPQPDLGFFKDLLRQATARDEGNWVCLPRIYVNELLVLQRKTWYVPVAELPLRQPTETEAGYFLRINAWQKKHHLPEAVFITVGPPEWSAGEEQRFSGKDQRHKPQYIHFRTPALVSLFGRELPKVTTMLKIEEMLPSGEELLLVNGRRHAVEVVVQWDDMLIS